MRWDIMNNLYNFVFQLIQIRYQHLMPNHISKSNRHDIKVILLVIASYFIFQYLLDNSFSSIRSLIKSIIDNHVISGIITYMIVIIPLIIATLIIHKGKDFWTSLGLNTSIAQGLMISFIGTLPMLIGFAIVFDINPNLSLNKIIWGAVVAAFFEELIYRGFFFGQLFRYTRLGFISTILLVSILFALQHLYQSQDFATLLGIFVTTLLGSVLFGWLFIEWNLNLWVPIFLHFFMNAYWITFAASSNALGNTTANICRIASIILIIALTIIYKKRKGLPLYINKKNLLLNP